MRHAFVTLIATLLLSSAVFAQAPGGNLFPSPGQKNGEKPKTEVTAALVAGEDPRALTLQIRLDLPEGANTYSMDPTLPKPTRITVSLPEGWKELEKDFTADPPPKKSFDEAFGRELEKFYGSVVFSKRFALPTGLNPADARLACKISFLVCEDDNCTPQSASLEARYTRKTLKKREKVSLLDVLSDESLSQQTAADAPAATEGAFVPAMTAGYVVIPKRKAPSGEVPDPVSVQFELSSEDAKAGETVTLAITMVLADNWSTYGLTPADDSQIETPTSIKFKGENLEAIGSLTSIPEAELHTNNLNGEIVRSNAHEHQVTWQQKFKVISDAPYGLTGTIRYQICEIGQTCLAPLSLTYSLGNNQKAEHIAGAQPIVKSYIDVKLEDLPNFHVKSSGTDFTYAGAFLAAFLAGLIMNVLPCVLPVLAIKILSLVQQAGESRTRIITLNLSYTAGVMSVFMAFAFFSWGLGQSLSAVFQNEIFMIVMACVVFLMGLSLFGVFELPVPGIIPSAGHHQEGYIGAFNTGIIATVLGTPCLGPFIAPVFTWTLTQPTIVVFSIFGMMGLGMASPFLLTGIFPELVKWLPRPGDWMVRFKQFTGFILMATVIWLLVSIEMAWRVPVLVLLLSLAMLVWMWANLASPHDPFSKRFRASLAAVLTAAPIFLFGLWMMMEYQPGKASKMPWQPFSEQQLVKLRDEGRPILIDFTANWCVICKFNEKLALDRESTVKFVEENGFVPMMADFTKDNPEILKWLREFGQESVPLTIIIPPGKESEIIALRGQYSQTTLLEKLKIAVGKQRETEVSPKALGTAI